MKKTYKCGYKQCKSGNEVDKDVAVKKSNRYYHKECLEEMDNKAEIRKLFLEEINQTEVISNLNRVINNITEDKGVSSEFLLFALKHVIKNKTPLNHAPGLYYIINNDKIKEEYNKKKSDLAMKQIKSNNSNNNFDDNEIKFNINIDNKNSWENILGR